MIFCLHTVTELMVVTDHMTHEAENMFYLAFWGKYADLVAKYYYSFLIHLNVFGDRHTIFLSSRWITDDRSIIY